MDAHCHLRRTATQSALLVSLAALAVLAGCGGGDGTDANAQSPSMTLDRPFFYAVRDDKSGALLFIGALLDPTGT